MRAPLKVLILGAGFCGLTLAYELRKRGFAITLVDQSPQIGGLLHTTISAHQLAESAASGFFLSDNLSALLTELQIPFLEQLPEGQKKFIYRERLRRLPLNFSEVLQVLLKTGPRIVLKRLLQPRAHETLATWAQRNFPDAAIRYLVEPFFQGIHAGDLHQMQASLVLEHFFNRTNRKTKRRYVAPEMGMSAGLELLMQKLKAEGVEFQLGRHVSDESGLADLQRETQCDYTILATSLKDVEPILPSGRWWAWSKSMSPSTTTPNPCQVLVF